MADRPIPLSVQATLNSYDFTTAVDAESKEFTFRISRNRHNHGIAKLTAADALQHATVIAERLGKKVVDA